MRFIYLEFPSKCGATHRLPIPLAKALGKTFRVDPLVLGPPNMRRPAETRLRTTITSASDLVNFDDYGRNPAEFGRVPVLLVLAIHRRNEKQQSVEQQGEKQHTGKQHSGKRKKPPGYRGLFLVLAQTIKPVIRLV
jgi:hypothetical protein